MLKVIVDRLKWIRGEGVKASFLLRPGDYKMCCMGFACEAAGISRENLLNKKVVTDVIDARCEISHPLHGFCSHLMVDAFDNTVAGIIYMINDNEALTDSKRESRLIELGRMVDIDFEFIN